MSRRGALPQRFASLAVAAALIACGSETAPSGAQLRFVVLRGNGQIGRVGEETPTPVEVAVQTRAGVGTSGVPVALAPSQGGAVDRATVVSGNDGTIRVRWTLGSVPGEQSLTMTSEGINPLRVTATATPGPPATMEAITPLMQFVVLRRPVAQLPTVRLLDRFGNPSPGASVQFIGTFGTKIEGATPLSDAAGEARLGGWTAGSLPVAEIVRAQGNGLPWIEFTAIVTPAVLVPVGPFDQTANVGTAVAQPPAVRAVDDDGAPVPGVGVTFQVEQGDGRVVGSSALTDVRGEARAAAWILGPAAGANLLTAATPGIPSRPAFSATGLDAVPALAVAAAGAGQVGLANNFATELPVVRVTDASGRPVAGGPVTFALVGGGGQIAGPSATFDENGRAELAGWRLGSAGPQSVRATVPGLPPVTFDAQAIDPTASTLDVDLRFDVPLSPAERAAFDGAVARWRTLLIGDLPDVPIAFGSDPAGCYPALQLTVDDVLIFVHVEDLDGEGGVLGFAAPCLARDASLLPVVGIMVFDQADVERLVGTNLLTEVVTHELGHVLGFGRVVFDLGGLYDGSVADDPQFAGSSARGAYRILAPAGSALSARGVPLENTGGPGTAGSHWRESVFGTELMTGFANPSPNPLSAITAAAMRDLGYLVNDVAADSYSFLAMVRQAAQTRSLPHSSPWTGPLVTVDGQGRARRVFRRDH